MWLYVALSVALLAVAYRPFLRLLTPPRIPGIPAYPDAMPLLGDMLRLGKWLEHSTLGSFFNQCSKDLGVISQIRLGWTSKWELKSVTVDNGRMVIVADYQTTEDILTKQHGSFDRDRRTIDIFRGLIPNAQISLPTNDMWKHHRRIIGPAMTSKYLSLTTPRANESIKELIELWRLKGKHGNVWSAQSDMLNLTMVRPRGSGAEDRTRFAVWPSVLLGASSGPPFSRSRRPVAPTSLSRSLNLPKAHFRSST